MIPFQNILLCPMWFRAAPNPRLLDWLDQARRAGMEVMRPSQEYGIDVARNANCRRFLDEYTPGGFTHLLMIDSDMVPVPGTAPILSVPGDIVYCGYVGNGLTSGHFGDGVFGAGCCRLSARALQHIPVPWFEFELNAARDTKAMCECGVFNRRAAAAGFHSRMVGVVGHETRILAVPNATGGFGVNLGDFQPRFDIPPQPTKGAD